MSAFRRSPSPRPRATGPPTIGPRPPFPPPRNPGVFPFTVRVPHHRLRPGARSIDNTEARGEFARPLTSGRFVGADAPGCATTHLWARWGRRQTGYGHDPRHRLHEPLLRSPLWGRPPDPMARPFRGTTLGTLRTLPKIGNYAAGPGRMGTRPIAARPGTCPEDPLTGLRSLRPRGFSRSARRETAHDGASLGPPSAGRNLTLQADDGFRDVALGRF